MPPLFFKKNGAERKFPLSQGPVAAATTVCRHSKITHDNALRPMIEPINVVRKKRRQKVAGSLKMKMPTSTAPTAPIPVHTG